MPRRAESHGWRSITWSGVISTIGGKSGERAVGRPPVAVEALEPRRLLSVSLPRDVNATPLASAALGQFVPLNGQLYFVHDDGQHGPELFRSDGTAAGTTLVKDVRPGRAGSAVGGLTVVNGLLYFQANDGVTGGEVWRSDGTEAGTVRVADALPRTESSSPYGFTAGPNGQVLYFAYSSNSSNANGLWTTDGTAAGTRPLKSLYSQYGQVGAEPVMLGDTLYFIVGGTTAGGELWRSDGTADGTRRVQHFHNQSPVQNLTVAGGRLFFTTGRKNLYVSDGTTENTTLLRTVGTGGTNQGGGVIAGGMANLRAVGDTVFFTVNDGATGNELWAADAESVWQVKDIYPGGTSSNSNPTSLVAYKGALYFAASNGTNGNELWTSDGTDGGTRMVADLRTYLATSASSSPTNLTVAGDTLYFAASGVVGSTAHFGAYTSDGTAAGTVPLKAFGAGYTAFKPTGFTPVGGGQVLFAASDGAAGPELWATGGTTDSTRLVRDVYPATGDARPRYIGTFKDRLYYFAIDADHGAEPWYTDGTAAGTALLKNINPGGDAIGFYGDPRGMATSQYLYFTAYDGASGGNFQLWRTDGTLDGTVKLRAFGNRINTWAVANDRIYFTLDSNSGVYTSDGTAAGTVPVAGSTGFSYLTESVGGSFYGSAYTATHGTELARLTPNPSSPASASLTRLSDVHPGSGDANPVGITAVGSTIFFFADDAPTGGNKLFKYTPAGGVTLVKDVQPGGSDYYSSGIVASGGKLYFASTAYGTTGEELYVSDGTAAGTRLVADLLPGSQSSYPAQLFDLDGIVLLKAADRLYRSDGTAAGTYVLRDVAPEHNGVSSQSAFVRLGEHVYLPGFSRGAQGLWRTDGTVAGTTLAAAVDPGGTGYSGQLAVVGGRVLFTGDDGVTGHEVWAYAPDAPPLSIAAVSFAPGGGAGAGLTFRADRALVDVAMPLDLTLTNVATGATLPAVNARRAVNPDGSMTYTFAGYPGSQLPDGNYRAVLPAGAVRDAAGDPLSLEAAIDFFVLAGDADRDRVVGPGDFSAVSINFGKTAQGWAEGDFDGDGVVGPADFNILAAKFGTTLPAPLPAGGGSVAPADGAQPAFSSATTTATPSADAAAATSAGAPPPNRPRVAAPAAVPGRPPRQPLKPRLAASVLVEDVPRVADSARRKGREA